MQVRVTLSNNRIVDVEALQLPNDRSRSQQISEFAGPRLRQEALQAQNAQIHTVSGATYTSGGYRQSLQAALDQAGRH
ncbi:MAG: FMN-binding protein [Actinomycetota bacterium]|nr:FMN-binding protein [Actinomycetota bacterium]